MQVKTLQEYRDFISAKGLNVKRSGFSVPKEAINSALKDHQRDVVRWSILGGCRAIFASFGLGKTVMQLEISRLTGEHHEGLSLIVAPLGVKQEFARDAKTVLGLTPPAVRP